MHYACGEVVRELKIQALNIRLPLINRPSQKKCNYVQMNSDVQNDERVGRKGKLRSELNTEAILDITDIERKKGGEICYKYRRRLFTFDINKIRAI